MELGRRFWARDVLPARRRDVVLEMFLLLENLHNRRGIVHGDVKESNFLWGRDGRLKLIDFSSARFIEESQDSWNSSYATEAYFTPERMRRLEYSFQASGGGGGRIPVPTVFDDYYALAVTLWSVFAGKRPRSRQFNQKNIRRADLLEVEDELVRGWIKKVFKMAGCRLM
jgi:serine/threonine protein kinase